MFISKYKGKLKRAETFCLFVSLFVGGWQKLIHSPLASQFSRKDFDILALFSLTH